MRPAQRLSDTSLTGGSVHQEHRPRTPVQVHGSETVSLVQPNQSDAADTCRRQPA